MADLPELVPLRNTISGQVAMVPPGEVPNYLGTNQFTPMTPAEIKWHQMNTAPAGGLTERAKALGMGFLGTMAPVVGPWVATKTVTSPEEALNWEDQHPIAHGIGSGLAILGTLGVGAAVRGVGAAGKALGAGMDAARVAKIAGTAANIERAAQWSAPGLLEMAGGAAENLLVKQAAQGVERTAMGRLMAAAVNQGVQGAGYGLALGANRAVLGDPHMTAEEILREGGLGLMWGAGLGAGGSAAWTGVKALAGGVTTGAENLGVLLTRGDPDTKQFVFTHRAKFNRLAKEIPGSGRLMGGDLPVNQMQFFLDNENLLREVVQKPSVMESFLRMERGTADAVVKNFDRVLEYEKNSPHLLDVLSHTSPELAEQVIDAWPKMLSDPAARESVVRALRDGSEALLRGGDEVGAAYDEFRRVISSKAFSGHGPNAPDGSGRIKLVTGQKYLDNQAATMLKELRDSVAKMAEDPKKFLPRIRSEVEGATDRFAERMKTITRKEDFWYLLQETKDLISKSLPWEEAKGLPKLLKNSTNDELARLARFFNAAEKHEGIFGRPARLLSEWDAAKTVEIGARRDFVKALGMSKKSLLEEPGGQVWAASLDKLESGVKAMANGEGAPFNEVFERYLASYRNLVTMMEKHGFDGATVARQQLDAAERSFTELRARAQATALVKSIRSKGGYEYVSGAAAERDITMQLVGYVGPRVAGVKLGGRILQAMEMLRSPYVAARVLDTVENVGRKTAAVIDGAVGRVFGSTATGVAASTHTPVTRENFDMWAGQMTKLGDPEIAAQRMEERMGPLTTTIVPLSRILHSQVVGRSQHIQQKIPRPVKVGVVDRPYVPSKTQLHELNQVLEIHSSPTVIAEKISQGRMTDGHKRAAVNAWPGHMARFRTAMMEKVLADPEGFKKLPRAVRANIAQFLEVDLEWAHSGHAVAGTQRLFQSLQTPQQAGQVGSQKARNVELKSQKLYATSTDSALRHLEGRG